MRLNPSFHLVFSKISENSEFSEILGTSWYDSIFGVEAAKPDMLHFKAGL